MTSSPEQNHNQEHTQQTANPVGAGTSPQTNSPIKGAKLPNFPPGLEIHNYVIMNLLGRGGMGVVYRAHHKILDKDLAIKFLKTESVDERAWERFKLEAKTLGRLRHRNLVGIHDLGLFQDTFPYYVMDLLDGESLFDLVRRVGPLTEEEVVEIFIQAASGLACAHENGILHRDVKPANIVVTWAESNMSPVVKVVDFGLAKLVESNQSLTKTGEVNGSPLYMSPEQCEAGKLDERTDIYSLGCSMYEALTARVPFLGNSAFETMLMHQQDEPPTLAQQMPDLTFSPEIEAIIAKMLAKNKEHRYQKMTQVISDLRTLDAKNKRKLHPGIQTSAIKDLEEAEEELEQSKREKKARFQVIAVYGFLGLLLLGTGGFLLYGFSQKQREQDALSKRIEKVPSLEEELKLIKSFHQPNSSKEWTEFKFPQTSIGIIKSDEAIRIAKEANALNLGSCDAKGEIACKKLTKDTTTGAFHIKDIEFYPAPETVSHPEIMSKFAPEDITILNLDNVAPNAAAFLLASTTLSSLKEIECNKLQDKDLPSLDRIDSLAILRISGPTITGSKLATTKLIKKIRKLTYHNPNETTQLMTALQQNTHLTELDLSGRNSEKTILSPEAIKQMAKLNTIEELNLSESNISAEMLKELSSMQEVKRLAICNCQFTGSSAAKALQKWPKLSSIVTDTNTISEIDKKILRDAKKIVVDSTDSYKEQVIAESYWRKKEKKHQSKDTQEIINEATTEMRDFLGR